MKWRLFLDDERFPAKNQENKLDDWLIARNTLDAMWHIENLGMPYAMSLDHDLGNNQPTGYDFVKWLVNQDMDGIINLDDCENIYVHSQNPVGAQNMREYFKNYNEMRLR